MKGNDGQRRGAWYGRPMPGDRGTEIRIQRRSRARESALADVLRARPLLTVATAFLLGVALALRAGR